MPQIRFSLGRARGRGWAYLRALGIFRVARLPTWRPEDDSYFGETALRTGTVSILTPAWCDH